PEGTLFSVRTSRDARHFEAKICRFPRQIFELSENERIAAPGCKAATGRFTSTVGSGLSTSHSAGSAGLVSRSKETPLRRAELFSLTSTMRGHISRATSLLRRERGKPIGGLDGYETKDCEEAGEEGGG